MADGNYNGLDQILDAYELERAALWADKTNLNPRYGPENADTRCVAEWADDLDNFHRATQPRLSGLVINVREYGAVGDGVTEDTEAVQAALTAAPEGSRVYFPAGTYLCGNLTFSNKTGVVLCSSGATIQWTGNAGGGFNRIGLQIVGTITRCLIVGLRLLGNGVLADGHAGIYMDSGQTLEDLTIDSVHVQDVTLGISLNADGGGSFRDCTVKHCRIDNVVGINSGFGYGLHFAEGSGGNTRTLFLDNHINQAQRHSIYVARGYGLRCIGNTIDRHRDGTSDGAVRGAIVVARGGDHVIAGNNITRSNNAAIFLDAGDNASETLTNVQVTGNVIEDPTSSAFLIPLIYIGEDLSTPTDRIDAIAIVGNTVRASAWNQSAIRFNWGHGVVIAHNTIQLLGVTATTYGVALQGRGESSLSATYSSRLTIAKNDIRITDGGGGSSSAAFRLNPPFNDDSTIDVHFEGNTALAPGGMFSTSASIVNPNVAVLNQVSTGLTFSGTNDLAPVGPLVGSSLRITGNITLPSIGTAVLLGDGSTSGNVWIEPRKGDANSLTFMQWRVGTAAGGLRWLDQFDSSENLNRQRYDSSGVFVDTPISTAWATGLTTFTQVTIPTVVGAVNMSTGSLTMTTGNISLIAAGALVILGDGSTSGNVGWESRKADGNNITFATLRVGTAGSGLRHLWQHDSSENVNFQVADGSGNLHAIIPVRLAYNATSGRPYLSVSRLTRDRSTALQASDVALSAGWGTGNSVSVLSGSNFSRGQITITPAGTPTANPTVTITDPDGTWAAAGITLSQRNGGTDTVFYVPGQHWTTTDSATTIVFTMVGTPVAGNTVIIRWDRAG